MRGFTYAGRIARITMFVLAVGVGVLHGSSVSAFGGSGAGTSGSPYQITTCAQLSSMNLDLTAYYVVANDIDCTGESSGWSPIGASGGFTGTLDGQGHKISHLDLSSISDSTNYAGMFSTIKGAAVVKNVRVLNGQLNAGNNSGMIAGGIYDNATLDNVYVQAAVTCHGQNCGGLVGGLHDTSVINNSGADVTVSNDDISTGGLVGWISGAGVIQESFAAGNVTGTLYVGGLVGAVNNGGSVAVITNTYANAMVAGSDYLGGLVGLGAELNLTKSYATGSVSGADSIGGLVGLFYGYMAETFAANTITGTGGAVGPVTGHFAGGSVGNRYFDAAITGFDDSPDGSTPISSSDYFKGNSTNPPFNQWDFGSVWRTNYKSYPSFAPKIDPYMLCEAPSSTDTTATARCEVAPLGWGTPSWQARWSIHGANNWHSITLNDIHEASATVTGLIPGTEYDISFRYTNDFGTGPWGTVVILTTGHAPVSNGGSGSTSSEAVLQNIIQAASRFYGVTTTTDSSDNSTTVPETSITPSRKPIKADDPSDSNVTAVVPEVKTQPQYNWTVITFSTLGFLVLGWLVLKYSRRHH